MPNNELMRCCLSVVFVYGSSSCRSLDAKYDFYLGLFQLFRNLCLTDVMIVAGGFTVQLGGETKADQRPIS